MNYYNNEKKLELKFKNIEIVYITPKKQLWGILHNGNKKFITGKITNTIDLRDFIQNKKLISYKDSKLFKKKIEFKFVSEGIELILKNKKCIIKVLSHKYLEKEFLCLLDNQKEPIVQIKLKKEVINEKNNQLFYNKSPLRYPGGKTRACKTLHAILNSHFDLKDFKYIISPFFGGGSFEFFLSNKYKYKIFANDLYYYLANFWNVCKTNKEELGILLEKAPKIDKETFYHYKKILQSTDNKTLQAYYFFILNRCSFNGTVGSGGFSSIAAKDRFTKSSINLILNLNLSKFTISNCDFEIFLKNNNKEKGLIYLDPPYFSNKDSKLYGSSGDLHMNFDHVRLFKYISTKHDWIMTYDNCSFIRDLYKDFIQIEAGWSYGMTTSKRELVILGKKKLVQ